MKRVVALRRQSLVNALIALALAIAVIILGFGQNEAHADTGRVVIVVPHCDDEAIFAGEVLGEYARQKRWVAIVFTTDCGGPPSYEVSHPYYARDRYNFAKKQLNGLGYTDIRTLGGDTGYNGKTLTQKTDDIARRLKRSRVIRAGDEVWIISNTGHIDHQAGYLATARLAKSKGISKMYVYWAYEDAGLIYAPREGTTVTSFATAENRTVKNSLLLGYFNFFATYYPDRQESLLTARKYADDVISYVWLAAP